MTLTVHITKLLLHLHVERDDRDHLWLDYAGWSACESRGGGHGGWWLYNCYDRSRVLQDQLFWCEEIHNVGTFYWRLCLTGNSLYVFGC